MPQLDPFISLYHESAGLIKERIAGHTFEVTSLNAGSENFAILAGFFVAIGCLAMIYRAITGKSPVEEDVTESAESSIENTYHEPLLVYEGHSLGFEDDLLISILQKRFPYYNLLDKPDKEKFLHRLKKFMRDKIFSIHDDKGFREMPILISASAIQLTFGLEKFLLPFYKYIHIYPAEFIGTWPTIRYLMGNVSGNTINIGWKYFLYDIEHPADGKNLGLHEMSHALYYQTFVVEEHVDYDFKRTFNEFTTVGDKVYTKTELNRDGLYSEYALKNFQEFWAESVEIFFEKPLEMRKKYPDLYDAIADLFNQDPAERRLLPRS